jgi:hypothetical protein
LNESTDTINAPNRAWDIANVRISCDAYWWGFALHLNEDAVQLLEQIRNLTELLIKWLGPELEVPVKAAILLEKLWIKAVDKGNGVKLVSPWVSPTMLVPLPEDEVHIDDTHLYWNIFDPDPDTKRWSNDSKFPASYAEVGPAVATFGGRLICVHRGSSGDACLWWTSYDSTNGWATDQRFPAHVSAVEPALAVFQDRLYCVHQGDADDLNLYWATFDGTSWSYDRQFSLVTSVGPALAAFQNRLICVHRGAQNDDRMYWTAFDGVTWCDTTPMTGHHTPSQPALVVFQEKLHCVYMTADNDLAWAVFNEGKWNEPSNVGAVTSSGPALAVRDNQLYCVYVGESNDCVLFWCSFDGASWTSSHRTSVRANDTPALILYRDQHTTNSGKNHLMCIHRGYRT